MTNYPTTMKMEYTNKKWDLDSMKIKIKNLKKIIPFHIVNIHLSVNKVNAKSELDAYYLTYYELKDMFLKYKRSSFGDTTKNIKKVYELDWKNILDEQLTVATATEPSSNYTNAHINNSIYGAYNVYDSYMTNNIVVDYDESLRGYY